MSGQWIALAVAAGIVLLLWLPLSRRSAQSPRWFILAIWALLFAQFAPEWIRLAIEAAVLLGSLGAWLRQPPGERRGRRLVGWSIAILVLWCLLAFHPNIPNLTVGALGARQAAFATTGVIMGCALRREQLRAAETTVTRALVVAVGVSILVHLYRPSIELSISRAAGEYTAVFDGEARLQGVFAGPFHAATAAALLLVWAIARFRTPGTSRLLWAAAVGVGGYALVLTHVRTAYVALALAVMVWLLASRNLGLLGRTFVVLGGIGAAYYFLATSDGANSTFASITNYSTDSRLLNRLPQYREGLDMFRQSPLIGMGAGSAGDTLGAQFFGREHVTPHNLVLKIAVEGGIVGLLAWAGLAFSAFRAVAPSLRQGLLAALSAVVLLGFGITGSAIDALPASFLIFVFIGMAANERRGRPLRNSDLEPVRSVADEPYRLPLSQGQRASGPVEGLAASGGD